MTILAKHAKVAAVEEQHRIAARRLDMVDLQSVGPATHQTCPLLSEHMLPKRLPLLRMIELVVGARRPMAAGILASLTGLIVPKAISKMLIAVTLPIDSQ